MYVFFVQFIEHAPLHSVALQNMPYSKLCTFKGSDIIARQKLKLEDRCSNNQAEQLAIHKALEERELLNRHSISPLTAIIYTDSSMNVCMYVCVYIYIYRHVCRTKCVCVYVCMYVCMYIYIYR